MSRSTPPINNERQLRGQLEDQRRGLRAVQEEDVIVELPRRLLLRSPNGTFFAITVDDAGVVSALNVGTTL